MLRKLVEIDDEKCIGCGLCIDACHEGALALVDGKAKLVKQDHCDGLGNCLPECPTGAISIIEKDTNAEQEAAKQTEITEQKNTPCNSEKTAEKAPLACGCPGTMAKRLEPRKDLPMKDNIQETGTCCNESLSSELRQWPVKLKLINPDADYLADADLLFAADCTAYAYARFHKEFMKGKITIIVCPKLEDNQYNTEKITEILKKNPKSITVARMTVPCCSGLERAVKQAMLNAKKIVPYQEIVITPDGEIV